MWEFYYCMCISSASKKKKIMTEVGGTKCSSTRTTLDFFYAVVTNDTSLIRQKSKTNSKTNG